MSYKNTKFRFPWNNPCSLPNGKKKITHGYRWTTKRIYTVVFPANKWTHGQTSVNHGKYSRLCHLDNHRCYSHLDSRRCYNHLDNHQCYNHLDFSNLLPLGFRIPYFPVCRRSRWHYQVRKCLHPFKRRLSRHHRHMIRIVLLRRYMIRIARCLRRTTP